MSSFSILPKRPSTPLVLATCLIPLLVLCACLALFGVDVFYWDEWMIWSNVLRDMRQEALDIATLAAQQNEQRNLAARAIGLLLMPFCKLNRFCEYTTIVLIVAGFSLLLRRMWLRTARQLDIQEGRWLPLAMVALLFSTQQWQLFAFGVNTSIAFTVLCCVAGVALLQTERLNLWRTLLLSVIGWAGSFNFANGLFFWIYLIPLFFTAKAEKRTRYLNLALFLLAGAGAWLLYFHGYVKPPHHPSLLFALSRPFSFIGYFFAYLGAPLSVDENLLPLSVCMGLTAFIFMGMLLWRLLRQEPELLRPLAPWLTLAVFALMSDGATALGRAGFGMHQALQSRYATFANLFWCALLVLWMVARARLRSNKRLLTWQKRFMALALCVFLLGSALSVIVFYNRRPQLLAARNELFSLAHGAPTERIFPDPNYLRKIIPLFFEPRLSVYREVKHLSDYKPLPLPPGAAGSVHEIRYVEPGGEMPSGVLLRGHAPDPTRRGEPARLVCLVSEGRIVFATKPAKNGDFEVFLPSDYFSTTTPRLMPLAVLADGESAAFLEMPDSGALTLPPAWYPPFVIDKYFFSPRD